MLACDQLALIKKRVTSERKRLNNEYDSFNSYTPKSEKEYIRGKVNALIDLGNFIAILEDN